MGRIIRVITLPFRLLVGLALGLWGVFYAFWLLAKSAWNQRGQENQGGQTEEEALGPEDFEDPEPPTTEPLSMSLDMVLQSMDEIRITPSTPFVPWWKRPGAKRRD